MPFRAGEQARGMRVLLSARIEVSARGRRIEEVLPGDGRAILSPLDGLPRPAAAMAPAPSEVVAPDGRVFRFVVEGTPGFVWFVPGGMARRLRAANAALWRARRRMAGSGRAGRRARA